MSDFLRKDIPGAKLPDTKRECPQCGLVLAGGESKCPRCGVPLSAEEALLECPECGALLPKDWKSCNRCGYNLIEPRAPAPRPSHPAPPSPVSVRAATLSVPVSVTKSVDEMPSPKPVQPEPPVAEKVTEAVTKPGAIRASTTGFVNGRGAVNGTGLVNGRGAVNGTGLVNGRGAINGAGVSAGSRSEPRSPSSASRSKRLVSRWQFLALLVALVIVIPTFMYLTYSHQAAAIVIDGEFDDWTEVETFGMFQNPALDRANVTEWAVKTDASNLYFYVATQVEMMSTSSLDSFFLFVDSDGSNATGYSVSGIGADYRVELGGWNGSVETKSVSRFGAGGDDHDWNAWESYGTPTVQLNSNRMEGAAGIASLGSNAEYVLLAECEQSVQGMSYAVREGVPVLILHQEPGFSISSGIVASSASVSVMRLTLSCQGGSGEVTSIVPAVSGATLIPTLEGTISLSKGSSRTINVMVNTANEATETLMTASLDSSGVSSTFDSVVVTGGPVKAYVGSAPAAIHIDGAFADWAGLTSVDDDPNPIADPNIDMQSVGAVNTTQTSYFYIGVEGEICGGSFVPALLTKPTGSGGGTVIPTKKTGEDILRIYVDADLSEGTGSVVTSASKTIGADYMIELLGLDGVITSKAVRRFDSGGWTVTTGAIDAANDRSRLELGVASAAISGASSIDFVIETTNWRGLSDIATSTPHGTRTQASDVRGWIIDDTIASADATAASCQRKLFYDGTSFWSVYVDGSNTVARYSTDGITWTAYGQVFKTAGVIKASIWYDSANRIVYAVGSTTTANRNVCLQRGTVDPSTHSISWTAADRVLTVSSFNTGSKNTYISKDASGYIWLMATNCTGFLPTRYDLSVFRSSAPDSVLGTWSPAGSMGISTPQATSKGCLVPAGSGSNMWAVYVYMGTVASREYAGAWSAETVLCTPTAGASNTEDAPPSAVVDSKGVVHVVYGDDHEQPTGTSKPHIFYRYNAGTGWSAQVAVSSSAQNEGFRYPTVSLDSSTGNIYVFWYSLQTFMVMAKRNVSGTWSALTLNPQTADAKGYLTSIYSVAGEGHICYLWTQNTTAPIHVIFDKIPEFSEVVLPVLGIALLLAIATGPDRRRRSRN